MPSRRHRVGVSNPRLQPPISSETQLAPSAPSVPLTSRLGQVNLDDLLAWPLTGVPDGDGDVEILSLGHAGVAVGELAPVFTVRGVWCGYSAVVSADARPAPVVLGSWPTPLEPAPRLAAAVGLAADALWVKRDDLTGLGGGGNKVRKLQYTCAQALAAGATTVITSGAPQSNHARLTAAAAARLGLRSVLVLQGEEPEVPAGNLVLELLAGARLVWTGPATAEQARREVRRQAEKVRQDGGIPHVIPHGGSNSYAAQAYVDCSGELLAQLPGLDHVIVAFGSGATMAGLVAGLGAERVIGIDTGAVADSCGRLSELLDGMPDVRVRRADLQLDDGQVGAAMSR